MGAPPAMGSLWGSLMVRALHASQPGRSVVCSARMSAAHGWQRYSLLVHMYLTVNVSRRILY